MKRIYYTTARRLGYRSFSEIKGGDVIELKRMLHTLGCWRKELEKFPESPELDSRPDDNLRRNDPKAWSDAWSVYRKKYNEYFEAYAYYDAETMDAVDAFRKEHGLDYTGNPRGLVDERLVKALRKAYYLGKKQSAADEPN